MTRIFLAGPLRTQAERSLLRKIETAVRANGSVVFVPHKVIGILRKDCSDLSPLRRNLVELQRCDVGIFLIEGERTGTGIELGYLCRLLDGGESNARLFGFCRPDSMKNLDLMAKFCIQTRGRMTTSIEELRRLVHKAEKCP